VVRSSIALPEGPLLKDNIGRAQWAEEAGYDDLWLADGTGPDGLTLAAVLACHTKRIRIGMAVTPAFTRPPALLAATISVLDQVLPNRCLWVIDRDRVLEFHGDSNIDACDQD